MEKKMEEANSPPSYINLGFDDEAVAVPSALIINDRASGSGIISCPLGPSTAPPTYCPPGPFEPPPKYEESGTSIGPAILKIPTAPYTERTLHTLACKPPSLLFEDIFEACVIYAESNCCYSSRFIRQMKLTSIVNKSAFHYSLESFGEKRESATKHEPYKGGPIDGANNGPAPSPWDIVVLPPELFKKGKTQLTIPHTDEVRTCSNCSGRGRVTCRSCAGSGRGSCWSCHGSGRDSGRRRCSMCGGSGRGSCASCGGSGRKTCLTCDGHGQIKSYKILVINWENHQSNFASNVRQMPAKKLQKVTGDVLVSETDKKLNPIVNAPDNTVNVASARLLEAHENSFPNELIIRQRHCLKAIPFTVVEYQWKDEEGEFYVYGHERKVFFEAYPTNCCCICC